MNSVVVRKLESGDVEFAYEMTVVEQWNDRLEDIRRMYTFEPDGCFIAEADEKPAGHVFAIRYEILGWIGLLIVKAEYRRKGIARLLMKKAKDYLLNHGVETIRLEAVPEISALYREFGFSDEFDSLRFAGRSKETVSSESSSATLDSEDIDQVAKFDSRYFGADRTRVIRKLWEETPQLCFISYSGKEISGYAMCRKGEIGYKIGPWVCKPNKPRVARELLTQCLSKLKPETKVFVGVPAVNTTAARILKDQGFIQHSKSIRMRFGKELESECAEGVFAIGGPMKG